MEENQAQGGSEYYAEAPEGQRKQAIGQELVRKKLQRERAEGRKRTDVS